VLGSAATAFHFHELDYSVLILAAWLVLRTSPPLWHRIYLLAGVVPMQMMIFGQDPNPGGTNILWHAPILIWEVGWLGILAWSTADAWKSVLVIPNFAARRRESRA
jgi:hypothetical protein